MTASLDVALLYVMTTALGIIRQKVMNSLLL